MAALQRSHQRFRPASQPNASRTLKPISRPGSFGAHSVVPGVVFEFAQSKLLPLTCLPEHGVQIVNAPCVVVQHRAAYRANENRLSVLLVGMHGVRG